MSSPTGSGSGGTGPSNEDLWQLYKIAVEEYRFQVNLNWQRSQYFLGLNAIIIGVGAGLVQLQPTGTEDGAPLTVAVFLVGVVLAMSSIFGLWQQHAYYRKARDRMLDVGDLLDLGILAVASTPGSVGQSKRLLKVQNVSYVVLAILGCVDLFGAFYVATRST